MPSINQIANKAINKALTRRGNPGPFKPSRKPRGFTNKDLANKVIRESRQTKLLKESNYHGAGSTGYAPPKPKVSKTSRTRAVNTAKKADAAGSKNKMPARGYTQAQLNAAKGRKAAARKRAVGIAKKAGVAGSTNRMPARGYTQAQLNAAKSRKATVRKRSVVRKPQM